MPADPVPLSSLHIFLLVSSLVAAMLFPFLAALLERSGPIRLSHFTEEAGGRLRLLFERPRRFSAFRFLFSLAGRVAPVALAISLGLVLLQAGWTAWTSLVLAFVATVALALISELVSLRLIRRNAEPLLRRSTWIFRAGALLVGPVLPLISWIVPRPYDVNLADPGEDDASDDEIEAFIAVGSREGILEPMEEELVRSIVEFGDVQVRSVMTPRIDMVCALESMTIDELAALFTDSRHSRLPLFDESIDRIVGVVYLLDVLKAMIEGSPETPRELARPPYFVPVTKPAAELLRELQNRYQQIAIVLDEYGGTAGLATVEDLLEEIVGEIVDEHDEAPVSIEPLKSGGFRVDGRTRIEELAELMGLEIRNGSYETVAGWVLSEHGDVPQAGAVIESGGLRVKVEKVSERRIQSVIVEGGEIAQEGA